MEEQKQPRIRWDPSISFGSIITVFTLVASLIGSVIAANTSWTRMDARVAAVEGAVASIRQSIATAEQRARDSDAELRVGVRRVDDKLAALLIQGYRTNTIIQPTPRGRDD